MTTLPAVCMHACMLIAYQPVARQAGGHNIILVLERLNATDTNRTAGAALPVHWPSSTASTSYTGLLCDCFCGCCWWHWHHTAEWLLLFSLTLRKKRSETDRWGGYRCRVLGVICERNGKRLVERPRSRCRVRRRGPRLRAAGCEERWACEANDILKVVWKRRLCEKAPLYSRDGEDKVGERGRDCWRNSVRNYTGDWFRS